MSQSSHQAPTSSSQCPQCGGHVFSTGDSSQLQCAFCEAITLLTPADASQDAAPLSRNTLVDLSKFNLYVDRDYLKIWWSWNRYAGIASLVGSLAALAFAVMYLGPTLALLKAGEFQQKHLSVAIFGLIPLLAFVSLAYAGLAMILNRSIITIEDGVLKSSHPPLPCYLWRRLPLADLKELKTHRVKKKRRRGEVTLGSDEQYELHAITKAGHKIVILKQENTADAPRAVRAVINAHIAGQLQPSASNTSPSDAPRESETTEQAKKVVLICPQCGGLTPPPQQMTSSQCTYCEAELEIDDEIWKSVGLHPPQRRNIDHVPVTLVVREEGEVLTITADWNRAGAIPVLIVCLSIVGLAFAMCLGMLWFEGWSIARFLQGGTLFGFFVSLFIAAPAACLGYLALCQWINRTKVTVTPGRVRVWNGPLPLRRTAEMPTDRIKQVSVHPSAQINARGKTRGSYDLDAISDYGATLPLLLDQTELKGLRTIEQLIEQRLEIADKMVSGEA